MHDLWSLVPLRALEARLHISNLMAASNGVSAKTEELVCRTHRLNHSMEVAVVPPTKSVSKLGADETLRSYTVQQVAELLSVGSDQVRTWIVTGDLFAFCTNLRKNPVRRKYRIPVYAVRDFIQSHAAAKVEPCS